MKRTGKSFWSDYSLERLSEEHIMDLAKKIPRSKNEYCNERLCDRKYFKICHMMKAMKSKNLHIVH
jgi:hypothetical protein